MPGISDVSVNHLAMAIAEAAARYPDAPRKEQLFAGRIARYPRALELRRRRVARIVDLIGARDGLVLDAGSGNGLNAILCLACGAREVWAVDFGPRYRCAELIVDALISQGYAELSDRLHLVHQSLYDVDLPTRAFDAAYTTEVLEHVASPRELHALLHDWLVPGARVYHRSGANGSNLFKRRIFDKRLDQEDVEYGPIRREMIRGLARGISEADLDRLVAATRGLVADEVAAAVSAWQTDGHLDTAAAKRRVPREPNLGMYCDHAVDPRNLLAEIGAAGFDARLIRPDFTHIFVGQRSLLWAYRVAGVLLSVLHPLSLPIAPWFEIVARRD